MSNVFVGIVFLCVGAGVYHFNTQSHDRQIIFPTLTPDQTVAALFGIGVVMVCVGALRWIFGSKPEAIEEEERPF
ncbi:MAG: hypothetical protein KDA24_21860 [Deltaproteobacteria bacterium]|nr:hypothetical protein [Deltaproteobacteria bacterium]